MNPEESISHQFDSELDKISKSPIFDPAFRKKKLLMWGVRTLLTVVLYVIFWKHNWVKWSLLVIAPLNLFSLFTILGMPYILKKKMERARQKAMEADEIIKASEMKKE